MTSWLYDCLLDQPFEEFLSGRLSSRVKVGVLQCNLFKVLGVDGSGEVFQLGLTQCLLIVQVRDYHFGILFVPFLLLQHVMEGI